ncbi:RNA-binding motif protein, X-linked 2 [Geodia barretti]|uniref:RNA-binding motif protein, X-linked 2 n=1 Tax=Geodia barretti TaxID=519541 RepID=A0AA35X9L9_GEOBA|nr:RNA-binding motif protein, X-linked 2 [Geodia barretti]
MTNTRTVLTSSLRRNLNDAGNVHYTGGLDYGLTEGDVLSVFSQYGEIVNINLVRDRKSGQSKGFCFLAYEDQRSTVLAVDNLNGFKLCGRTLRVDHVHQYRRPKDEDGNEIIEKGCAPITPTPSPTPSPEPELSEPKAKKRKVKDKTKKGKKKEKKPKKKRHK